MNLLLKMVKNKKALVRILEAFIAIVLITAVFAVLYTRNVSRIERGEQIYKLEESILDEVASDETLRKNILSDEPDLNEIKSFIAPRIPPVFNFEIKICSIGEVCELESYLGEEGKEVYSAERIISVTIKQQDLNPKVLKIFVWEV